MNSFTKCTFSAALCASAVPSFSFLARPSSVSRASSIQRPQDLVSNSSARGVPFEVWLFLKGQASYRLGDHLSHLISCHTAIPNK